jgi:hypothetical protein
MGYVGLAISATGVVQMGGIYGLDDAWAHHDIQEDLNPKRGVLPLLLQALPSLANKQSGPHFP